LNKKHSKVQRFKGSREKEIIGTIGGAPCSAKTFFLLLATCYKLLMDKRNK